MKRTLLLALALSIGFGAAWADSDAIASLQMTIEALIVIAEVHSLVAGITESPSRIVSG